MSSRLLSFVCQPSLISPFFVSGFGAEPGSGFTIHQVQHISIALLFFFGGGLGLVLESSLARNLLAAPVAILDGRGIRNVEKPPTWTGSFNPFPALVIGVVSRNAPPTSTASETGLTMFSSFPDWTRHELSSSDVPVPDPDSCSLGKPSGHVRIFPDRVSSRCSLFSLRLDASSLF